MGGGEAGAGRGASDTAPHLLKPCVCPHIAGLPNTMDSMRFSEEDLKQIAAGWSHRPALPRQDIMSKAEHLPPAAIQQLLDDVGKTLMPERTVLP